MVSPTLGLTATVRGTQHTTSDQRGHAAAVLRPSDAISCVFRSSPTGRSYIITENAKAGHCGSDSGLPVGSKGQECNEAPWEGALSHVTPPVHRWPPQQVCPMRLPRPRQSPTTKGQEAEPWPRTRGPVVRRSVTREKGDQETSDTQGRQAATLGPTGQPTLRPLPA